MLGPEAFVATFQAPLVALLAAATAGAVWGLRGRRRLHRLLIGHAAIAALLVAAIASLHRMLSQIYPAADLASLAFVACVVAVVGVVGDIGSEAPARVWLRLLRIAVGMARHQTPVVRSLGPRGVGPRA